MQVSAPDETDRNLPKPTVEGDAHRLRNGLIWSAVLAVLLLGVGFAVPDLRGILERVADAQLGWLGLALAFEIASCLGYVATVRLVLRRAPAREARWLSWAEMAFGAVVPVGGAGGLALGAWAMRAWGAGWSRIINRSAVIFLLGHTVEAFGLSCLVAFLVGFVSYQTQGYREQLIARDRQSLSADRTPKNPYGRAQQSAGDRSEPGEGAGKKRTLGKVMAASAKSPPSQRLHACTAPDSALP